MSIVDILRDSYTKYKPIRLNLDNINQLNLKDVLIIAYLMEVKNINIIFDDDLDDLVYIDGDVMVFDKKIEDIKFISLIYVMYYSRLYQEKFSIYHSNDSVNYRDPNRREKRNMYRIDTDYYYESGFIGRCRDMGVIDLNLIKLIAEIIGIEIYNYPRSKEENARREYLELNRPWNPEVIKFIPIKAAKKI